MSPNESNEKVNELSTTIYLPRELRDQIYRELLVPEKNRNSRRSLPSYTLYPEILHVNKQTHQEASEILYGENICILFHMCLRDLEFGYSKARDDVHIFSGGLNYFPGQIAMYVDLTQWQVCHFGSPRAKILVGLCDLQRFFDVDLHDLNPTLCDLNVEVYEQRYQEQESLLDFFHRLRGIRKAWITGTILPSTGHELATLLTTPERHVDEIIERANVVQSRGKQKVNFGRFTEARNLFDHGFHYNRHRYNLRGPSSGGAAELEGRNEDSNTRLTYQSLSFWFDRALCNLRLENAMDWDVLDAGVTILYKIECNLDHDSYRDFWDLYCKGRESLEAGRGYSAMRIFLQVLRLHPARLRLDTEIDDMEGRLNAMIANHPDPPKQWK